MEAQKKRLQKTGFRTWKKASGESGKLANHAKTQMHILSMERMQNFKSDNQPVDEQLVGLAEASKTRKEEERKENRRKFSGSLFLSLKIFLQKSCLD